MAAPAWRTLQVCLLLVVGAVAVSYAGPAAAAAAVWATALVAALRYVWFGVRRRRFVLVVLAVAAFVLVASGGRAGGAIAAGILVGAVLLRGLETHRRIGDRPRAILFCVLWVPLLLALAVNPKLTEGPLRNFATMARVVLIVFLAATPVDLVAHMRLHFLRLRPKLAVCGIFIGVVPLVILAVIGLLLIWGALGGSRANRGADVMESWRQEWEAGGHLDGLPAVDRFAWGESDSTGVAPAGLGSYLKAYGDRGAVAGWVEADSGLWLMRTYGEPPRFAGLRLDNRSFDHLARILRADVAIIGVSVSDSTSRGVQITFEDEDLTPAARLLFGQYHERVPDGSFWHRDMYFGGSTLATSALDSTGLATGQVLLTVKTSLADLRDEFLSGRNNFNKVMIAVLGVVAGMLLVIEIFALVFGFRIAGGITTAVQELHRGTRRLATGDLDTHIEIPNEDEFGDLAAGFNEMATAVKQGREHALASQRLQQEMEMARQIQARLLPTSEPLVAGFEVTGVSVPSRQVGGDYFDFVPQTDGRLGIAIGDVSGKGVAAALLMANLQASLQGQVIHPASVAEVMARINNLLVQSTDSHMFASFFYGVLDPRAGRFTSANAGHNPPLLMRADGSAEWLTAGGLLLGMMPDISYTQSVIDFGRGDVLVLYTDGITEAEAPSAAGGEMFEEEGLERVVREVSQLSAAQIREAILAAVQNHLAGDPAGDDITLVVIKRTLGEKIVV
jgi:serine phosphatase RsbU (regulator of sigma subunit)